MIQINYLFVIISYIMNIVFGSLPISAWNDSSVGGKIQPYNLIDTDTSCYWKGFCPMFPPGGELSAFPNGEEKFQQLLHNLHRMFSNCSRNTSLGRYTYGGNTNGGLLEWCEGCTYCGTSVAGRKPLYWYSDANAAARFKQWDEHNCDQDWYAESGESAHSTCKWGLAEVTMWGKGINSVTPIDRCSMLSSNINQCQFSTRGSTFCSDTKDRCWFETEGICGGNSCLIDPHCEPVFAGKYDYVGKGFVGGMNGVDSVYSRFTKEIYYLLPIAAHFDARIHTASVDYRSDGKYFNLMLEYHDTNATQTVLTCYALYAGEMTEMPVYISGASPNQCSSQYYGSDEFSVMFHAFYTPHISCEPYAFICETSKNRFVRLPQEEEYYFGTEWTDWEWSDYSSYGYQECKEQHYYNHPSEGWTVNGGQTLIQSEIWYYHNGGKCIGCDKIAILNCLQDCIYSYNVTELCKSSCQAGVANTPSPIPIPTQPPTMQPTEAAAAQSPTLQPTTNGPTLSPTPFPTVSPTPFPTVKPTNTPTEHPTIQPTAAPTTPSPTRRSRLVPTTNAPATDAPTQRFQRGATAASTQSTSDRSTIQSPTAQPSESPITAAESGRASLTPIEIPEEPVQTGETCKSVLNWTYNWSNLAKWNENMSVALCRIAETAFIAQHSECGGSNDLEYYYYFSWSGFKPASKPKLGIFMLICCGEGKTFGPDYEISNDVPEKDKYTANSVLNSKYGQE